MNEKENTKRDSKQITITLSADVFDIVDRISHINRRTKKNQIEATVESVFLNYETVKKLLIML